MIRDALEYLAGVLKAPPPQIDALGRSWLTVGVEPPPDPSPHTVEVVFLDELIDLLVADSHGLALRKPVVRVASPVLVEAISDPDVYGRRVVLARARADVQAPTITRDWVTAETAKIELASMFAPSGDRDRVIEIMGRIVGTEIRELADDGMSQETTTRANVATLGREVLPRFVALAPYSTFPEVESPTREFVMRIRATGVEAEPFKIRLFEADGSRWRVEVRRRVAKHLGDGGVINVLGYVKAGS